MMKEIQLLKLIANDISNKGGVLYLVGGCVRDEILGKENKDIDVEVHNISFETLKDILKQYGVVDEVGSSFGVLIIKGYDIDFTMPRNERKISDGHKGFEVIVNPYIGTYEASKRRDITINALMKNISTGEIVDHFNGLMDIQNKRIHYIDDKTFVEDPLRVFRVAQFASRFQFDISEETINLCKAVDVTSLSRERVFKELEKAILKSDKPSVFFKYLKEMDKLEPYFNDLNKLSEEKFIDLMSRIDNLEVKKVELVLSLIAFYTQTFETLLNPITNEKKLIKSVEINLKGLNLLNERLNDTLFRKVAYVTLNQVYFNVLVQVMTDDSSFIIKQLELAKTLVSKPLINSKDLLELGFKPGKEFGEILKFSMDLQVEGLSKDEIIKKITSH